jgi:ubiquinol-cytochrome c reductase cytochrome b subunit
LFASKGCAHCHVVNGRGGDKGPDLTHAGRRLSKQKIEKQILEGGNMMPAYKDSLTPEETKLLVRYLHKLR